MKSFRAIGRLSAAAAAVALIATSAVPAVAGTRDPTATTDKAEAKPSQKICVQETLSGSRVPRKVCKTRAQWIAEEGADPSSR